MVGFAATPPAYVQTPTPYGFTSVASALTSDDGEQPSRGRPAGDEVLEPGDGDRRRPQEERPVDARPDEHEQRDRPDETRSTLAPGQDRHGRREEDHPEELGSERERDEADREAGEREPGRQPESGTCPATAEEHQRGDEPDEHRPGNGEERPAAEPEDGPEHDLGRPLLVEPRQAGGGERERVRRRERAVVEDDLPGPDVVGEVHGRQRRQERPEHGQQDGEARPQLREREPRQPTARRGRGGAFRHHPRCYPARRRWRSPERPSRPPPRSGGPPEHPRRRSARPRGPSARCRTARGPGRGPLVRACRQAGDRAAGG